jgi:RNA polymerase sigma-70 factor (ECF subfamily)
VEIPPETKKLCIGLQVYGPGKVWFYDVRASYADKPAPNPHNILKNPGFEDGVIGPDNWEQGAEIEGVKYSWDKKVAFEGKASVCIEKTAKKYFPIAQWSQTVERQDDKSALMVSAQVKAKKMTKAILDVAFLDENAMPISHEWVAFIGIKETGDKPADHDWKQYSGKVNIPPQTKEMCIGLQVYGPGKVWFDDVQVSYADNSVKSVFWGDTV